MIHTELAKGAISSIMHLRPRFGFSRGVIIETFLKVWNTDMIKRNHGVMTSFIKFLLWIKTSCLIFVMLTLLSLSPQHANTYWKIELYTSHTKVIMLLIDHSLSFPEKQNKIPWLGGQWWYSETILFAVHTIVLLSLFVDWIVKYLFHLRLQRVFTSTLGMYLTDCKTSTL